MLRIFLYFGLLIVGISCATHKTYYGDGYQQNQPSTSAINYSILFFGGGDKTSDNMAPAMAALRNQLGEVNKGSLILLGNNGAKRGLTDSLHHNIRQKTEEVLHKKLSMLSAFKGDIYIVPGNHDWDDGGRQGFKKVTLLEEYVEEVINREQDVVVPSNGCPGTSEVNGASYCIW